MTKFKLFHKTPETYGRYLLLALLGVILSTGLTACRVNPVTGENQLIMHSAEQELAMGKSYHPNLIYMYNGRYPGKPNAYLEAIVERIHTISHRRDIEMGFTLLNTSMNNAFAIPGHVYATRGFVAELDNEAQFAAVMAHEIAHVASLHSAQQMTTNVFTNLGIGLAAQAGGDTAASQGLVAAGQLGVTMLGLSYSREQERQADRVGTYYLAIAGWDPREAISMQKLLHSMNENEPTFVDKYLSTHPPADDRIEEIKAVIQEKNLLDSDHLQGDGIFKERWHRRMAELRRVNKAYEPYDEGMKLMAKKEYNDALGQAEKALERRKDQAPFYRLKGDALLQLDRLDEAREQYRQSLKLDSNYVFANLGLGQIALEEERYANAEEQFETAVDAFPASVNGQYGLGIARLKQRQFQDAIDPLQSVTRAVPDEPEPHYYLGVSYDNTGEPRGALIEYKRAIKAGLSGDKARQARSRIQTIEKQIGPNEDAQ